MSSAILAIAGTMFIVPMLLMLGIALAGFDIPSTILQFGGWSMALSALVAGLGVVFAWGGN